jgi:hypothetical protein
MRCLLFIMCLLSFTVSTTLAQNISACPTPANDPALDTSVDFFDFGVEFETYLSNGGTLEGLLAAMRSRPIMSAPYAKRGGGQTPIGAWNTDVNGDALEDIVVNLHGGSAENAHAAIWLYFCERSIYRLVTGITHDAPYGMFRDVMQVTYVQDLTNDGRAEIVYHSTVCAPRLCDTLIHVMRWNEEAQALTQLPFNPEVYNYDQYRIEDMDENGLHEIVRTGGLCLHDEPGGWRSLRGLPDVVYEWDGEVFRQVRYSVI